MRIIRLSVKNYRGISALETEVPEHGMVVSGGNGRGKTSVLRALQAALGAQGIDPGAIRLGEDKAEILVDLGDVSVRRVITHNGSSLKVSLPNGDVKAKPTAFLSELLGTSALDPIELFLEKDAKKRRAMILAALPITLTPEHITRWVPDWISVDFASYPPGMHGLDALANLRGNIYDARKRENDKLPGVRSNIAMYEKELAGLPEVVDANPNAEDERDAAVAALDGARAEVAAAERAAAASLGTRQKVTDLRAKATEGRARADSIDVVDDAWLEEQRTRGRVIAAEMAKLNAELAAIKKAVDAALENASAREAALRTAAEQDARADELEAAIVVPPHPSAERIAQLEADVAAGDAAMVKAAAAANRALCIRNLDSCRAFEKEASDKAGRLTTIVDTLTNVAPKELIAESQGIEGLGVSEEGDITLDGVSLDALSGAEQLRFAVEIARRANAKARILIVDGLERLDPDTLPTFIAHATADGYQLLATRVAAGDVVLESIEPPKAVDGGSDG